MRTRGPRGAFKARRGLILAVVAVAVVIIGAVIPIVTSQDAADRSASSAASQFLLPASTTACPSDACTNALNRLAEGAKIDSLPTDLIASLPDSANDLVRPDGGQCIHALSPAGLRDDDQPCSFDTGATQEAPTIILFGDSQALMWSKSVLAMAAQRGYRFVLLYRTSCVMPVVVIPDRAADPICNLWRDTAIDWINQQRPAVVILTSGHHDVKLTDTQMTAGYVELLGRLKAPDRRVVLLSDIPHQRQDPPRCLAAHSSSALACGRPPMEASPPNESQMVLDATRQSGADYVNLLPFLCTEQICPVVIGSQLAYMNPSHLTSNFAQSLSPVLQESLKLPHA
jgi:hypothetical protein